MEHSWNPSICQAEAGEQSLRAAWAAWQIPGQLELQGKILSQKRKEKKVRKRTLKRANDKSTHSIGKESLHIYLSITGRSSNNKSEFI